MTSAQCRLFSQIAAESRAACSGEAAGYNGATITIVCQPLTALAIEMGGFEASGQMKALVYGVTIPSVHDHLTVRSKRWVVKSKIVNLASVETALLLDAVPA
jgi:hypothetical protein